MTRRKSLIGNFFDNSKGKIGKQKLGNRLKFMAKINWDWIDTTMTKDRLRVRLKNTYFGDWTWGNDDDNNDDVMMTEI